MKYAIIILSIISVSCTYAQQDTMYLKNKFNKNGNVVFKDTTWMRAPLFYVDTIDGSPVTGIVVEKHRKGKRITHARNGYTLKQVGYMKKSVFYLFYDPDNKNYVSVQQWNKGNKFKVLCMSDDKYPFGVDFEKVKNGEIRKTVSKKEEIITFDFMMKTLVETLPQYEADFRQLFSKI